MNAISYDENLEIIVSFHVINQGLLYSSMINGVGEIIRGIALQLKMLILG